MSGEDEQRRGKRDSEIPCITHHSLELKVDVYVCLFMSLGMTACDTAQIL